MRTKRSARLVVYGDLSFIVDTKSSQSLSAIASMMMGAPVVDRTGLTGTFNVAVSFSPEGVRPFAGEFVRPGQRSAGDQELPSLRDALRDQLGLKLESGRGPVDVLVIDSVQPPTEN